MEDDALKSGQTKTENGATAWATNALASQMGLDNPVVETMVNILVTLWSATGTKTDTIREKTFEFLNAAKKLQETDQESANNFLSLFMAFTLYVRSVRNGKGRKDESRASLLPICLEFVDQHEQLVEMLLTSYFTQGYWKDAWLLLEEENLDANIRRLVLQILAGRLLKDFQICESISKLDAKSDPVERELLVKQLSNCAKFCPQVKGQKKGPKAKNYIAVCLPLAQLLFPQIPQDTWYYRNKEGKLDTSEKYQVGEKTPAYYKWRSLLKKYKEFMKKLRDNIPFVEKYLHNGTYQEVNPKMLTSVNKMRLNDALKNKPPRYLKPGAKTNIPKKKLAELRQKYGNQKRVDDNDRDLCLERMEKHEKELTKKQEEKKAKLAALRQKLNDVDDSDQELKAELEAEMQALQEEKITNFSAGTPIDVLKAYRGCNDVNPTFESCIAELALGPFSNLLHESILCMSDTSGSMNKYGYNYVPFSEDNLAMPIDVCVAMTAFFAMHAPAGWRNRYIQLNTEPSIEDVEKVLGHQPSFFEFCKHMLSHRFDFGSTNFEGVLETLKTLFTGAESKNLPRYLIMFSDNQFNKQVRIENKGNTAAEQLRELFVDTMGFNETDVPIFIFWNLSDHENRPALASDQGVIMLSGFNPKMLLDFHTIVENSITQEELNNLEENLKAEQEYNQKVNTWTTIVKTLAGSEATVPFLMEVHEHLEHTLLDFDDE